MVYDMFISRIFFSGWQVKWLGMDYTWGLPNMGKFPHMCTPAWTITKSTHSCHVEGGIITRAAQKGEVNFIGILILWCKSSVNDCIMSVNDGVCISLPVNHQ